MRNGSQARITSADNLTRAARVSPRFVDVPASVSVWSGSRDDRSAEADDESALAMPRADPFGLRTQESLATDGAQAQRAGRCERRSRGRDAATTPRGSYGHSDHDRGSPGP